MGKRFFFGILLQTILISLVFIIQPSEVQAVSSVAASTAPVTYTPTTLPFDGSVGAESTGGVMSSLTAYTMLSLGSKDPVSATFAAVNILIGLLGLVFLVLLVYGGVIWVLAKGNEEEIGKAKTVLFRAIIGLVIILSAYGMSYLVFMQLYNKTGLT
ncbi:MAG: hypothetical protein ACD_21C00164G0001 [uncultured bacterium]|nr:MAG: hypothetical protein ACD_21C00164G0001 [uncultured bacterium]